MPYFKGKGYGEAGEAMEEVVEAESKYDAKEQFKAMFAGGLTVLSEVPAPAGEAPKDGEPDTVEDGSPSSDQPSTDTEATGGDDAPPAAA